jgi:hypothetical protein
MREMVENNFEEIKVNVVNVKLNEAYKNIANISNNAIINQLNLQSDDYANMVSKQREIITTMEVASTELKVTLQETSEYLELDYSLSSSDVVKWNTQSRTITVNDVDVRENISFDSQWFQLPVGSFTLVAEPSEVMLQATYRPRWI